MGDLSAFPDRDALKATYRALHPNRSDGHVNTQAGQLWRFARQMQVDDLVVVPLRFIREIAVGEITGEYRWTTDYGPDMPHVRDVEWFMTDAPRDAFPSDLLFLWGLDVRLLGYPQQRRVPGPRPYRLTPYLRPMSGRLASR